MRRHPVPSGAAFRTAAATLVAFAVASAPAYAQDDPGQAAYAAACAMCHGANASGAMGPGLVPLVIGLDEFRKIVRGGLGQMPEIPASQASDADVAAIHNYLERLGGRPAPAAATAPAAPIDEDMNVRIDRARRDHDLRALAAAIDATSSTLSQLAVAERGAHVASAFAAWEWVVQQPQPPPESVKLIDRAIDHVERAIQLNDRVADTHAFMATLCALRLTLGASPPPTVSARIGSELARAKALDAEGPRVLLLTGIAGVLSPAKAGGLDAAEQALRRARALLPETSSGFAWPAWTAADAAAWLGRAREQRGDRAGARQAYEEALRLRPNDQWIGQVLLPSVRR